ncbi:efflux RND transporter periplasmic adaptor subunit [Sandaracinobacter neustonicus]|uniref:Efflux RND transporter periplasmic adaptor subunit n=2 Tax=Sandaracinobacter neustonicus TaxID=1715348 RepID=A0A501XEC4_9SPHN|nr:efflux RND transporter periplasmic adaptor subunit [Sandaracinobacter neustonicus]
MGLDKLCRISALALLTAVAACSGAEQPQMPPPEVSVETVRAGTIDNVIEVPGRVQAVRTAEVRARVTGIVARRLYEEGSDVRAGQPLFAIDPRELQASLSAALAQAQRAEATARNARQDVDRYRPLLTDQAISKQEYDAAVARLGQADADVLQARAQVESARLNLSYATVTAPISGRAGRAQVTEGALVNAGEGTLLTVIEQVNPIFVNFSQSSSEFIAIRRDIASGALKAPGVGHTRVELQLEDGTIFAQTGRLDFFDLAFDESTGAAALRAEFPNPGAILLPGQFVRARVFAGTRSNTILVPQRAVQVGPRGGAVLVVTADNKAEARPVQLGDLRGSQWVVLSGLKPGERVIVDGGQKVQQPGMTVRIAPPKPVPGQAGQNQAGANQAAPAGAN